MISRIFGIFGGYWGGVRNGKSSRTRDYKFRPDTHGDHDSHNVGDHIHREKSDKYCIGGCANFRSRIASLTHAVGIGRSRTRQWSAGITLAALTTLWAAAQWPPTLPPTSFLRYQDIKFQPFTVNVRPHIDLSIMSDSPFEIRAHQVTLIHVTNGLPNLAAVPQREKLIWDMVENRLSQDRSAQPALRDFYGESLPPKIVTMMGTDGQPHRIKPLHSNHKGVASYLCYLKSYMKNRTESMAWTFVSLCKTTIQPRIAVRLGTMALQK